MKEYEKMTKRELLKIAKIHGIKGRSRMSKEKLINEINKKKIPIKEMKKFEERLKKERPRIKQTGPENFVQILPKEPGTVFVHWESAVSGKEEMRLRFKEGRKSIVEIPIMSESGSGYMKVDEGKKVKVEIGTLKNGKFKKIAESPEILVPVGKPSDNKTVKWTDIRRRTAKTKKKIRLKNKALLEEKKKKTEKVAKSVHYIRVPKER